MQSRPVWMMLCFLLVVTACTQVPPSVITPTLIPTPPLIENPGFNLLIVAEGEVALKRNGWSDFHRTTFGTVIHRGDLLRVENSASAVVLCDDLSLWTVPAGATSGLNGCKLPPEPLLNWDESLIGNTRASGRLDIPFIISPRMTKLLTLNPELHWNSVPGASHYTVQILGDKFLYWEAEISSSETIYPGVPPLEPGVNYLLLVTADSGGSSRDEGVPGLGFTVLPESEAIQVQRAQSQLEALNFSDEAFSFALSQLYIGHDLYTEAIEILEALVETGTQSAVVFRMLGDLYLQIALPQLAEGYHLEAERLAGSAGDVEGQVLAQTGLVMVYTALGNPDEAIRWLNGALNGYGDFGEPANQLAERLGSAYLAVANLEEALRWWDVAQEGYQNIGDVARASKLAKQIGDVHANARQLDEAVILWREAWEGYHALGNLLQASELAEQLGEAYIVLDDIEEAIRWLNTARDGYENLQNLERMSEITERLQGLEQTK